MSNRKVEIQEKVLWKWRRSPTSSRFIAVCDALNLCLEADSEQEMQSLILEAMHLLIVDLFEDNEINQYLRDKGWHAQNLPNRPDGDVQFHVPFELIAEEEARRTCCPISEYKKCYCKRPCFAENEI